MNIQCSPIPAEPSAGNTLLHDVAAEQQLLGAVLNCPDAIDHAAAIVAPHDFLEPIHQQIFTRMLDLRARGLRSSAPLLNTHLGTLGERDIAGLPLKIYIAGLCSHATPIVNVPDFAKVVRHFAELRQVYAVLEGALELAKLSPIEIEPSDIIKETIDRLDNNGVVP